MITLNPKVRLVDPGLRNELQYIAESICTRQGLKPKRWIFVLEGSDRINAFTSGKHLIAITSAALKLLKRSLEAIIAHELGHQYKGDTIVQGLRWWYTLPSIIILRSGGTTNRYLQLTSFNYSIEWVHEYYGRHRR